VAAPAPAEASSSKSNRTATPAANGPTYELELAGDLAGIGW
jgi:hypothetical protein